MKRFLDDVGNATALALIALAVGLLVVPLLASVVMSFDARSYLGPFPPKSFSTRWYVEFANNDFYLSGIKTSLVLAVIVAVVSTAVGVSAALVFDRYRFPGKELLLAFFLSPLVAPGVVVGFGLLMFFSLMGVFDGFPRLVGGHIIMTIPYTIRTTLAGLVGIKKSLTEAALSLGANERQAFWNITFPLAQTGMAAGAVFAFAVSMEDTSVSMFLTDAKTLTLPVAMISMMRANFDLSIAACSVLLTGMTFAIILILDRSFGLEKVIGQGMYRS